MGSSHHRAGSGKQFSYNTALCSVAAVLIEFSSVPVHRHNSKYRPHFQVPIQCFIACFEFYPSFIPMSSPCCSESEKENYCVYSGTSLKGHLSNTLFNQDT